MTAEKLLEKYTNHKYAILTNRCNSAILIALNIAKSEGKTKVYIADQGGWFSFKNYPQILGLELHKIKTDYGIINPIELDVLDNKSALLITSFAGYFAEQDVKKISDICKQKGAFLIEDASGKIDTKYSDITVGSFSAWKPISIGCGGFISFSKELWKKDTLFTASSFDCNEDELEIQLKDLNNKMNFYYDLQKKVKNDLDKFQILHKSKRGLNIIVKYDSDKEKKKIIDYCKDKSFDYVTCPKYIRVNEKAISIELKRICKNSVR